ncbi:rod shape-determining protein MreD [Phocaeicola salanitronis]|uniref:rod shape-determining protein MreD n=1 Tax=Phocaeicola salanitronis TaxID=376805 RepID=UPI0025A48DE5|nr:rod shape-determining protein MreD [Phocaeicola salanitronis]MDM8304791.1 rod shape-determining protein MreD [Phocaeicola salanitronis]
MVQTLHRIVWFVVLVLVQVEILNHVHIMGYATPIVFIYYILALNSEISRKSLLLQAFFLGLCVDIFSNTPGMHAAASTFLAFLRRPLLQAQMLRETTDDYEPGVRSMGLGPFLRYVTSAVLAFVVAVRVIDAFNFFHFIELLLRIVTDTLVTVVCIMCIDVIRRRK